MLADTIAAASLFPASKSIVPCVIWLVKLVSCVRKYIFKTPNNMTTDPTSVYRKNLIAAYKRFSPPQIPIRKYIGTSDTSWEDAARNAVKTASKSLRDLRIAEITKLDVKIEDGKVVQFRARLALSFKYDS